MKLFTVVPDKCLCISFYSAHCYGHCGGFRMLTNPILDLMDQSVCKQCQSFQKAYRKKKRQSSVLRVREKAPGSSKTICLLSPFSIHFRTEKHTQRIIKNKKRYPNIKKYENWAVSNQHSSEIF